MARQPKRSGTVRARRDRMRRAFTQLDAIPNDLCRKRTDTCVNTRAMTG